MFGAASLNYSGLTFNRWIVTSLVLLFMLFTFELSAQPSSVNNLSGFYHSGQVFLTWQNTTDSLAFYKVYRSVVPITDSSQLAGCEYLGWTNAASSKDHNLSRHDGAARYLVIDSGAAPLNKATGLFVATTLADGNYYYAVTTYIGGMELLNIVTGVNSLQDPIAERVEAPQPVFQQQRFIGEKAVDIYATFASSKYAAGQPLMNEAGFMTNDFILYRNGATSGRHPLRIRFHGGGADFFYNVINVDQDEINLNPEDFLPGGDNSGWWGANEHFNIYASNGSQVPPVSGINYNFCHQRITQLINWAIRHLPVDSNRICLEGTSLGSVGAYFYALLYPERIAAVKLSGSVFDLSFNHDYNPSCTLNEGKINRISGDNRFGKVSTNLASNLGYNFYDVVNGNWIMHNFNERDYPVIYSVNGKHDTIVGWTEKTIYYDSVNANHAGGYYFWDGRKHGGGEGLVWSDDNFDLFRYRNNVVYPAFAHCSVNEDYGDGHAYSGADFGTVNGFLDWSNDITDDTSLLGITLFMKDLNRQDKSVYAAPPNCMVDVTMRRRQHFNPTAGEKLWWNVVHDNSVIQSGSLLYQGGLMSIPEVYVYKDSIRLTVTNDSSYLTGIAQKTLLIEYPNPVSHSATIQWNVSTPGNCSLKIYDVSGRWITTLAEGAMDAGTYQINWNIDDGRHVAVSNGIYLLRLETSTQSATQKLLVVR
ncbi:MAG: T9SS type A sorting domain-containing protein [Chitinophagales bacterium]|nr:T9SS type A sorting domain-containing protein [Chitinophagales bacterium]